MIINFLKFKIMEGLKLLRINLVQSIVYVEQENLINSIHAIYSSHKDLIVIPSEYTSLEDEIVNFIQSRLILQSRPAVISGNGFNIDTWDNVLANWKTA